MRAEVRGSMEHTGCQHAVHRWWRSSEATTCWLARLLAELINVAGRGPGDDVEAAAERWTQVRGPDARALADIESSFYKLVGGRRLGFLDPGFLRLIAHIGLGAPHHVTASLLPRACNGQAGWWDLL